MCRLDDLHVQGRKNVTTKVLKESYEMANRDDDRQRDEKRRQDNKRRDEKQSHEQRLRDDKIFFERKRLDELRRRDKSHADRRPKSSGDGSSAVGLAVIAVVVVIGAMLFAIK